ADDTRPENFNPLDGFIIQQRGEMARQDLNFGQFRHGLTLQGRKISIQPDLAIETCRSAGAIRLKSTATITASLREACGGLKSALLPGLKSSDWNSRQAISVWWKSKPMKTAHALAVAVGTRKRECVRQVPHFPHHGVVQ